MLLPSELALYAPALTHLARSWAASGALVVRLTAEASSEQGEGVSLLLHGEPTDDLRSNRVLLPIPGRPWFFEILSAAGIDENRLACEIEIVVRLSQREQEVNGLAAALAEANDQLVGFYDLASQTARAVNRGDLLAGMVERACSFGSFPAAVIMSAGQVYQHGSPRLLPILRHEAALPRGGVTVRRSEETGHPFDISIQRIGENSETLVVAGAVGTHLTQPQLRNLKAFASALGLMVELAGMHERALANAVIDRDVSTAATLAAQVLPSVVPDVPGLEIAGRSDPARLAAGDFYTYVLTDDALVAFTGDVSGKGLGAALVMTMVASAATTIAHRERGADPARLLQTLSNEVFGYLSETGVMVTLVCARWQVGADVIHVANAGHSPVLVRTEGTVRQVGVTAPPLGVVADLGSEVLELPFGEDDYLFLGTDGLVEQENREGLQIGYDHLLELVSTSRASSAQDLVSTVFARVDAHGAGTSQDDDRTLLVLHRQKEQPDLMSHSMEVPATLEALRAIPPFIENWLAQKLNSTQIGLLMPRIELAVQEVAVNVVRYAYGFDEESANEKGNPESFLIDLVCHDDLVEVAIVDKGDAFDPDSVQDPDPDEPQVGGYGLMIVRQLTSQFDIERTDAGNVTRLGFNIPLQVAV